MKGKRLSCGEKYPFKSVSSCQLAVVFHFVVLTKKKKKKKGGGGGGGGCRIGSSYEARNKAIILANLIHNCIVIVEKLAYNYL